MDAYLSFCLIPQIVIPYWGNTPIESSIAESLEPSGLALNFLYPHPSPMCRLHQDMEVRSPQKHNVPYSNPSSTSSSYVVDLSLTSSQRKRFTIFTPFFATFIDYFDQIIFLAVVASERTSCYVGGDGLAKPSFRKLGNAFRDTFPRSSSQSSPSSCGDWDADKVHKVLEGKAGLSSEYYSLEIQKNSSGQRKFDYLRESTIKLKIIIGFCEHLK